MFQKNIQQFFRVSDKTQVPSTTVRYILLLYLAQVPIFFNNFMKLRCTTSFKFSRLRHFSLVETGCILFRLKYNETYETIRSSFSLQFDGKKNLEKEAIGAKKFCHVNRSHSRWNECEAKKRTLILLRSITTPCKSSFKVAYCFKSVA